MHLNDGGFTGATFHATFGDGLSAVPNAAVIGVDIDYEVIGQSGSMLMVSVSGTAVRLT